jgi:hypothetical protein
MPAEVAPPELARLLDFAERPRVQDWSLRAALCRYAQPQPERVSTVLDLVRRIEFAFSQHTDAIASDGPAHWQAVESHDPVAGVDPFVAGLLHATRQLDRLGDVLAQWAADRTGERPDEAVDAATADVAQRLEELGVPHEDQSARRQRRPPRGT